MGWPFWGLVCLLVAMTALVVTLGILFAGERRRGRAERAALLAEQRQLSARVEELSDAHHLAVGGDNVMIAYLLEIERAGGT